jgi:hypothetical protein
VLFDCSDSLDSVIDDSDVGVDGLDMCSLLGAVATGVIVSARERATKQPFARGWVFQASVEIC